MRLVLVCLALMTFPLAAAEPPALAIEALERMDELDEKSWSYTKTTRTPEEVRVERHDASRPETERWTLVAIDGKKPTAGEIRSYQREKKKELERREGRSDDEQEIDRASIRLVSETPERATYSFHPSSSGWGGDELAEKIAGTLVVRKDGAWVERFELAADDEVRPIAGVKISDFSLILQFTRDSVSGDVLPSRFESRIRGRAFLVKSIDDERTSQFSDFEKVK